MEAQVQGNELCVQKAVNALHIMWLGITIRQPAMYDLGKIIVWPSSSPVFGRPRHR